MKIRMGFVSNSSSSSFVCEICGHTESGWDASPNELGFVECENGHCICEDERLIIETHDDPSVEEMRKRIARIQSLDSEDPEYQDLMECEGEELEDWYEEAICDDEYSMSPEECPICQFIIFSDYDLKSYLRKLYNISEDEILVDIKKANKRRRKVYAQEYVMYVCQKISINREQLVEEIRSVFKKYENFAKFCRS